MGKVAQRFGIYEKLCITTQISQFSLSVMPNPSTKFQKLLRNPTVVTNEQTDRPCYITSFYGEGNIDNSTVDGTPENAGLENDGRKCRARI